MACGKHCYCTCLLSIMLLLGIWKVKAFQTRRFSKAFVGPKVVQLVGIISSHVRVLIFVLMFI